MKSSFDILVVEDQTRHHKIFADTIEQEIGAKVRFAVSGEEGLKIIAEQHPDLVVLDLDLPRISGKEVLKQLKSDVRTRLIPVIVLTGSSSQLVEMDLLENGADDYLEKGSHPDILVSRIRAQIRHKKAIDRLQHLAIDRDIFAAGVLANISSARKTLNDQSELIRASLQRDPVAAIPEVLTVMDQMCEHASRLGQFASDVIQSVRDTHKSAVPRPIPLESFVERANAFEPAGAEGPRIKLTATTKLSTAHVDPDYFRILMMNLLQNITTRSGKTMGFAEAEISEVPAGTGTVKDDTKFKLILRDFGTAVSAKELATFFEPQIDSSGTGPDQTFDISLAVVSNVVRKINGDIWAESPADDRGGIEFHLLLPLHIPVASQKDK